MTFTAAMCKLQNVKVICSPLNGGLMEKISLTGVLVLDSSHFNAKQNSALPMFPRSGQPGLGGDA